MQRIKKMGTTVKPYQSEGSKKEQVQQMFDNIAHRYDFLNRFLSLGIDKGWRKKAIKMLEAYQPKRILDVATGTADFAIATLEINPEEVALVQDFEKALLSNLSSMY